MASKARTDRGNPIKDAGDQALNIKLSGNDGVAMKIEDGHFLYRD